MADMARSLAKWHAYVFYLLRTTFKSIFDDGWEDWKACVILTAAMNFGVIAVVNVLAVGLERFLFPDSRAQFFIIWGSISTVFWIANHYLLIADRKWSRFEKEFQHYPKIVRVVEGIVLWLCLVLVVVLAFWTAPIAVDATR